MTKRIIFALLSCVIFSSQMVSGAILDHGSSSPYDYLQNNPEQKEDFLDLMGQRTDLTELQKKAYIALVYGSNDTLMGDAVLDALPAKEVAWFYGFSDEIEENDGQFRLHNAARLQRQLQSYSYSDCLSRQICVMVSKSSQRLYAFYNGRQVYLPGRKAWVPVSTARPGKITPSGLFDVQELAHASRTSNLYPGAGLFYAMQIHGHIFIHGTNKSNYSRLGRRASSGCIRTTFKVAEFLNLWMREVGGRYSGVLRDRSRVRVIVSDSIPDEYLSVY